VIESKGKQRKAKECDRKQKNVTESERIERRDISEAVAKTREDRGYKCEGRGKKGYENAKEYEETRRKTKETLRKANLASTKNEAGHRIASTLFVNVSTL